MIGPLQYRSCHLASQDAHSDATAQTCCMGRGEHRADVSASWRHECMGMPCGRNAGRAWRRARVIRQPQTGIGLTSNIAGRSGVPRARCARPECHWRSARRSMPAARPPPSTAPAGLSSTSCISGAAGARGFRGRECTAPAALPTVGRPARSKQARQVAGRRPRAEANGRASMSKPRLLPVD